TTAASFFWWLFQSSRHFGLQNRCHDFSIRNSVSHHSQVAFGPNIFIRLLCWFRQDAIPHLPLPLYRLLARSQAFSNTYEHRSDRIPNRDLPSRSDASDKIRSQKK